MDLATLTAAVPFATLPDPSRSLTPASLVRLVLVNSSRSLRPAGFALVASAVVALVLACSDSGGGSDGRARTGGSVVVSTATEPATLFPPLVSGAPGNAIVGQLFDRLADIGDSLNTIGDAGFTPRLARRWTWAPDSLSITFTLDPTARWHDDIPVTAADVRFSFEVYTDPAVGSPTAALLANIDSVTAADSVSVTFWYKRRTPQQFFDATYELYVLPAHLLRGIPRDRLGASPFSRAPIGSGRFRFRRWTPRARIELESDEENYRGRARLDRLTWLVASDMGAATINLVNGTADVLDAMRPEYLGQLARNRTLRLVFYPSLDYGFVQFNLRDPNGGGGPHRLFADRALRRALTTAVDRGRLVTSAYDSLALVGVGPVTRALFPDWQSLRPLPSDVARARAMLDSLGWRDAGDGVRARGGTRLAFTLLIASSSPARQRMAAALRDQLRVVGADVTIESLPIATFAERQRGRDFDAALGGWQTEPSQGGIVQTWGSLGARPGGSNFGAYESPTFDAQVDSALGAYDRAASRRAWLHAYQTITDDAPAIWLFEPRLVAGVHRRIQVAGFRADAWWAHLADWSVP